MKTKYILDVNNNDCGEESSYWDDEYIEGGNKEDDDGSMWDDSAYDSKDNDDGASISTDSSEEMDADAYINGNTYTKSKPKQYRTTVQKKRRTTSHSSPKGKCIIIKKRKGDEVSIGVDSSQYSYSKRSFKAGQSEISTVSYYSPEGPPKNEYYSKDGHGKDLEAAVERKANRRTYIAMCSIGTFGLIICTVIVLFFMRSASNNPEGGNDMPSYAPTKRITKYPTLDQLGNNVPTDFPSTNTKYPTFSPSNLPTTNPTLSKKPSLNPTIKPSTTPSTIPSTSNPTITMNPTIEIPPSISAKPSEQPPTTTPSSSPSTFVHALVISVALEGGKEFLDPTSYQSQALAWLESDFGGTLNIAYDRVIQRYVAACIWFATNMVDNSYSTDEEIEDGWTSTDNWLTTANECTWYGLECNSAGKVNETDLRANNLTGTFPDEIILWADSLVYLDIGSNNVHNMDEEVEFLGKLTNLVHLDIGDTIFAYNGIPPALGSLTNLKILSIRDTMFNGPIRGPEVFTNMKKLEVLEMQNNRYNEEVPLEIGRLPQLTNFYCYEASLQGTLDFVKEMPEIFELWVDYNPNLSGSIPTEIGTKFRTLQSLSLTNCNITGTIPAEMGNLRYMQAIWLYDNHLTGTIPSELQMLDYLYEFDVSGNKLEGSMPDEVCDLVDEGNALLESLCVDCEEVGCCCCSCCSSSSCQRI
mmetsp:Transcript_27733/g.31699  ORF Transcript_27733/g.31699 Transcript_27733/m.31699 type:complete len:697 (-) Transcript_27733:85-2175(-)